MNGDEMSEEKRRALDRFVWREGDIEIIYDPYAGKDRKKRRESARKHGQEEPRAGKKDKE